MSPMPTPFAAEIDATTITRKLVRLPVGAEAALTNGEVRAWMRAHPGRRTMRLLVRCPGAARPAPYDVGVEDLLFALEPE